MEVVPEEEELEITGTGLVFGITFERVPVELVLANGLVAFTEGRAALLVVVVVVVVVDMMKARIGRGRCAGTSCRLERHLLTSKHTPDDTRRGMLVTWDDEGRGESLGQKLWGVRDSHMVVFTGLDPTQTWLRLPRDARRRYIN